MPIDSAPDAESLKQEALSQVQFAASLDALEQVRVAVLGKKGSLSLAMGQLGRMPPEERKTFGASINAAKQAVEEALATRKQALEASEMEARLKTEIADISLAVRPEAKGAIHPISKVMTEIQEIFADMGFAVALGPDIETDWYNFTALNIPPEHPARQMHDTFYLQGEEGNRPVLRTHTSPVQIRAMQAGQPPIRIIAPGNTYRADSDATHTPMFHQVEGIVIDKGIHMGHLKGCLEGFLKRFFGLETVPLRFRPSFFPFTEPSAEVDIGCKRGPDGVDVGKGTDWLEILGCGMIHPVVLKNGGIDPADYSGFAFGMGVERLAMLKYGMADLRLFFEGDLRWLQHYGFSPLS
ncbi:phenylalanine--tRNA ligase subunit alpha [bacterium]|nr:phenylalanine--tRNA ligase subunit alpha [bacterium]